LTKEELAKYYVQSIHSSTSKEQLVKSIINEIDSLNYETTKKPISDRDKIWILQYIREQLSLNRVQFGSDYLEKSSDNKYYLILISNALTVLSGGKK
jgi:hypothetical protein